MLAFLCLHLFSPRARWTTLVLLAAIFVTLTWVLPFLDQHIPIETEKILVWPSAGVSRIVGSGAIDGGLGLHSAKHVHKKGSTAVGRRDTLSVLNGPPMQFFRGEDLPCDQLTLMIVYLLLDNLRNDTYYLTTWTMAGFSTSQACAFRWIHQLIHLQPFTS
jgi:hypothetical protein